MSSEHSPQLGLPVETTIQILSYLDCDDDVQTLLSCARASRTWNTIVLPQLFSQLSITFVYTFKDDDHGPGDDQETNVSPDSQYKSLDEILSLLPQTGSRILPHVRELRLTQSWTSIPRDDALEEPATSHHVDASLLCDVIRLFPSIKRLNLVGILLRGRPDITLETNTQDLEELYIHLPWTYPDVYGNTDLQTTEKHLWMLRLFGSVKRLCLEHVDQPGDLMPHDNFSDILTNSSFHAEAVEFVNQVPAHLYLRAFHSSPLVLASLKSLDFKLFCHYLLFEELAALYAKLPGGLEHLSCDMTYQEFVDPPCLFRVLECPSFANIRSLEFHDLEWMLGNGANGKETWNVPGVQAMARILQLLTTLQPAELHHIKLNVHDALQGPTRTVFVPSAIRRAFDVMHESLLHLQAFKMLVIEVKQDAQTAKSISPLLRSFYRRVFSILYGEGRVQIIPAQEPGLSSTSTIDSVVDVSNTA